MYAPETATAGAVDLLVHAQYRGIRARDTIVPQNASRRHNWLSYSARTHVEGLDGCSLVLDLHCDTPVLVILGLFLAPAASPPCRLTTPRDHALYRGASRNRDGEELRENSRYDSRSEG